MITPMDIHNKQFTKATVRGYSEEEKTLAYASRCIEEGILLSAIRPPTVPAGTSRIRLTVTAAHTKEELDRAVAVMKAHFPLP